LAIWFLSSVCSFLISSLAALYFASKSLLIEKRLPKYPKQNSQLLTDVSFHFLTVLLGAEI